jgi:hypothetical protein
MRCTDFADSRHGCHHRVGKREKRAKLGARPAIQRAHRVRDGCLEDSKGDLVEGGRV